MVKWPVPAARALEENRILPQARSLTAFTKARMLSSGVPMGTPHPAEMELNPASADFLAASATSCGVPLNRGKEHPTLPIMAPRLLATLMARYGSTFSSTDIPVTPVSNMYGMIFSESPQMCRTFIPFRSPRHLFTNCPEWAVKSSGARISVDAEGSDI